MNQETVVTLLVALLGAGLLGYVRDTYRAWKRRIDDASPEAVARQHRLTELDHADKSSLLLVRENTTLATRNAQLYEELATLDKRHAREREAWEKEKAEMRAEIDALENKLRAMLDELVQLKTRHAIS